MPQIQKWNKKYPENAFMQVYMVFSVEIETLRDAGGRWGTLRDATGR